MMAKDKADKDAVLRRQQKLLAERYDLSPRVDKKVTMSRGKPIAVGPASLLPDGMTWEKLAEMAPADIRAHERFPKGVTKAGQTCDDGEGASRDHRERPGKPLELALLHQKLKRARTTSVRSRGSSL